MFYVGIPCSLPTLRLAAPLFCWPCSYRDWVPAVQSKTLSIQSFPWLGVPCEGPGGGPHPSPPA